MATIGTVGVTVLPPSGVPGAADRLLREAGNLAIWLDPADLTTRITSSASNKIVGIVEKTSSRVFRYAARNAGGALITEPPEANLDTSTFKSPAISMSDSWFYNDLNPVETNHNVLSDDDGNLVYFAVVKLQTAPVMDTLNPIYFYGGQADPNQKHQPGRQAITTIISQAPIPSQPDRTHLYFGTYNDFGAVGASPDMAPRGAVIFRIVIQNRPYNQSYISIHTNGSMVWEKGDVRTDIVDGNMSNAPFRSFGIDTSVGSGNTSFGEVVGYRGVLTDAKIAEIEEYLTAKWIKPTVVTSLGVLSNYIGIASQTFSATIQATNVSGVSLDFPLEDLPADWSTQLVSTAGSTTVWNVTGTMPASLTDFYIDVTAAGVDGEQTITKRFTIITTAAGIVPTEKTLYEGFGALSVWLDTSEPTTVIKNGQDQVIALRERKTTAKFLVSSSETPSVDTKTFSRNGLAFAKTTENTSGQPYAITLDTSTYPELNVFNVTQYLVNNSGALAGSPRSNGLQITGANGEYTVILVGSYTAKAGGTQAGELLIGSDFPNGQSPEYYVSQFGVSTSNLRSDPASMFAQDAGTVDVLAGPVYAPKNQQIADSVIEVGDKFIAVWRKKAGQDPEMFLATAGMTEAMVRGIGSNWSAPAQKFTRIFGSHALGSIGELLAYSTAITDPALNTLAAHLDTKWLSVVSPPPVFSDLSKYSEYVSSPFSATLTISNQTGDPISGLSVTSTAGTNWSLTPIAAGSTTFNLIGTMPAASQDFTVTLNATQSGIAASASYILHSQALPTGPEIGTLSPLSGATSTPYLGQLQILYAEDFWIEANAGTNWEITRVTPGGSNFQITSVLPSVVTTVTLVVRATRTVNISGTPTLIEAGRTFQLEVIKPGIIQATQYPLDLTGELVSNRVSEVQTLTPDNGVRRQMIVPALAPCYFHRMKLEYQDMVGGVWLEAVPHTDYQPFCEFSELSQAAAYPLYGAITINNTSFEGSVRLTYQTLGGNFVLDRKATLERLARVVWNQREINWSQVISLPNTFSVDTHEHDSENDIIGLLGFKNAITAALTGFVDNSLPADVRAMAAHILDQDNPHVLTAGDVNLQNVPNLPPANDTEARASNNSVRLMTPRGAAQSAQLHIQVATDSVTGKVILNQGSELSDATDSTKALTAAGLVNLMNNGSGNPLQLAFSAGDAVASFSPWPISFPRFWRGISYPSMDALMFAIRTHLDCETLVLDNVQGQLYVPRGVPAPSLVTTATQGTVTLRDSTTQDWTNAPMRVPVV